LVDEATDGAPLLPPGTIAAVELRTLELRVVDDGVYTGLLLDALAFADDLRRTPRGVRAAACEVEAFVR